MMDLRHSLSRATVESRGTPTTMAAQRLDPRLSPVNVTRDEAFLSELDASLSRAAVPELRALDAFKRNKVAILVATDIAARGLDIESLPHVVNYELPMVASDYVHRIGRTGRAGTDGDAISLVCVDEHAMLAEIERLLGHRVETEIVPGFARLEPATAWSGLRPVSSDLQPILGADPAEERLIYATGHSRNGVLMTPLTAECIAALLAGEPSPMDISAFSIERFPDPEAN